MSVYSKRSTVSTNLEDDQEEQPINEYAPDCDISQDACSQMMRIDSDCAIPVQSNECPCERTRDNRDVYESWMGVMTEIEGRQVEEVDNHNDLCPDEVPTDE